MAKPRLPLLYGDLSPCHLPGHKDGQRNPSKDTLQKIFMTSVLEGELENWHTAVTAFHPTLSYSLLTPLANPDSIEAWKSERRVLFLGLETWPCLLKDDAKLPQLTIELGRI